jgi:cytochrome c peroxidase
LADRIIKLETANRKTNLRPVKIGILVVACVVGVRMLLPKPPERIRESSVTEEQLTAFIKSSVRPSAIAPNESDLAIADFGSVIFRDNDFLPYQPGRSGRNESCSGCHDNEESEKKFLTSDRLAPDLRRTMFYQNFGTDGRAKNLETYIAKHIESPAELSSTRVQVAHIIMSKYRGKYEKVFGPIPPIANLPESGTPAVDRREFPVATSSFILETLADRKQLANVLRQAQAEHLAPAVILSRTVFAPMLPEHTQSENFERLNAETQIVVNTLFSNVTRALAAHIRQIPSAPTKYDIFSEKIASGQSLQESLTTDFGSDELTGLKLFAGEAKCGTCHFGPGFTDDKFHNIGLPDAAFPDPGRATGLMLVDVVRSCIPSESEPSAQVCKDNEASAEDMNAAVGAFRTAALRGFNSNGALMRNGQIESVADAVRFYGRLDDRPAIGHRSPLMEKIALTSEEKEALEKFLRTIAR